MTEANGLTRRGVLALAGASALGVWSASNRAEGEGDQDAKAHPAAIVGTWNATERHKSHGSLFQPNHEALKRDAVVYFEQQGNPCILNR